MFQGIYTLVLMAIFIAIIAWAYSKRQKSAFNEAANLVFADEAAHTDSLNGEQKNKSAHI
ncbi:MULTISPECIES: CcoQ/FixQ family Cbb3-type cytochrome c oxidase assembly chaperone [Moritella]|uniref:CcoQ/FixQ family Cbb3-type cytochrome c oxidase assembly chaperone n=1 Tax=Moritella TaxID=58050 RepID=UPI0002E7ECB2|nr:MULTISPECIES: CcoQ/FixQ family Cbb3-type cytochrome c oxidase assembly chaperone [Moritella]GIC78787.1 cytochrome oxidase [Moritella sp. F1]GIC83594.1 cytochrome oxidase [Moritella sp. F3]